MKMKVTNNYPSLFSTPHPRVRTYLNGKLFFKYRQKFRNKTRFIEGFRKLLSTPVKTLHEFTGIKKYQEFKHARGATIRMVRYEKN